MPSPAQLLPGTLDLLPWKAVLPGPWRGYGVLLRIGQISGQALLRGEAGGWNRLATAIASALAAQPEQI
jgi:hypothetical protein